MSGKLSLLGSLTLTPTGSQSWSLSPTVLADICETLYTEHEQVVPDFDLTTDSVTPFPFSSVVNAHAVFIRVVCGKVDVTLTSADGIAQVFPVEEWWGVISKTVPYTAISFQRVAGVPTTVRVVLAEKQS